MHRDRAKRHMATLPLRVNGAEFQGRPAGSLLVARVDGRPGPGGDWKLYVTLRRPPADPGRRSAHPTAFFPVRAPDLEYTFPEDEVTDPRTRRSALLDFPESVPAGT